MRVDPFPGLWGAFFDEIIDSNRILLEYYSIAFSGVGKRYRSGREGTQNSNLPKLSLYIVNSRNQNENFVYEVKKTIGLIDRSPNDRSNRPV